MTSSAKTAAQPAAPLGLVAILSFGWGLNWPILKVLMTEMPPLHSVALCMGYASLALFALARWRGESLRVPRGAWPTLAGISFFNMVLCSLGINVGVSMMESGRAAILAYTFPIWATPLAAWWLRERITPRKLAGLVLGMLGIALLLGGEISALGRAPAGALVMLGAALAWAVATVMTRARPLDIQPLAFTAWQMLLAFGPLLAGALALEDGSFSLTALSPKALAAFAYTLVIAYVVCYWTWTRIAVSVPASVSSLSILAVPVIGVLAGAALLGERPRLTDYAALVLVCAAVATALAPGKTEKG